MWFPPKHIWWIWLEKYCSSQHESESDLVSSDAQRCLIIFSLHTSPFPLTHSPYVFQHTHMAEEHFSDPVPRDSTSFVDRMAELVEEVTPTHFRTFRMPSTKTKFRTFRMPSKKTRKLSKACKPRLSNTSAAGSYFMTLVQTLERHGEFHEITAQVFVTAISSFMSLLLYGHFALTAGYYGGWCTCCFCWRACNNNNSRIAWRFC